MIGASPAEVIGHITCQPPHRAFTSRDLGIMSCVSVADCTCHAHVVILWYLELSVLTLQFAHALSLSFSHIGHRTDKFFLVLMNSALVIEIGFHVGRGRRSKIAIAPSVELDMFGMRCHGWLTLVYLSQLVMHYKGQAGQ